MSTPPVVTPQPSKLQLILSIVNLALQGLSTIPALSLPIAIEQTFQGILTKALAAYQAETGAPIDLTKLPQEALIP
jgi:hypothetical protein